MNQHQSVPPQTLRSMPRPQGRKITETGFITSMIGSLTPIALAGLLVLADGDPGVQLLAENIDVLVGGGVAATGGGLLYRAKTVKKEDQIEEEPPAPPVVVSQKPAVTVPASPFPNPPAQAPAATPTPPPEPPPAPPQHPFDRRAMSQAPEGQQVERVG